MVEADDKLDEAQVEHDTLKILIMDLEGGANSEFRDAKVKVLAEYVKHHVQEEEAGDGILEQGRKAGLDLNQLGQQMAQLKQQLQADPSQLRPRPVSLGQFRQSQQKEMSDMRQGYGNENGRGGSRERDERGRFMESRGGNDDNRRSSRGRGYDDDDRGGRNQGSGWYGDSRGHSEAARRGWENRDDDDRGGRSGGSRSGRGYDDDDRGGRSGSSRSSRGDDDGRGHGRGGWFGDPRGHSEASRRGWEDRR